MSTERTPEHDPDAKVHEDLGRASVPRRKIRPVDSQTTGDELIPTYDDLEPELPPGSKPGRILVHVLGAGATGVYRWEAEALDYDNDTAVFWINEGVGFDWFFDSIDFPGEGYWVVQDVTVSWTRGDGWEIDDDEDHDWGEIRPATPTEIETGLMENQNASE